jgi:hypothetical protein
MSFVKTPTLGLPDPAEMLTSLDDGFRRDLIVQALGARALLQGEGKHMKVRNGECLDQGAGLFKGPFRLSWKSREKIDAYGYMGDGSDSVMDQVSKKR